MKNGEDPILLEQDGGIFRMRFNRPAVLNAINPQVAEAFLAACRTIAAAAGVRVVVLSGEGRAFMAGGDLACFHADHPRADETARAILTPLHEGLAILAELPQPVLASLHGAVAGAGVSLALASDLAIAADDARFTLAYSRIGASVDASASWSLPRAVGLRKAMEIAILAETFDAAEALRLGLVARVIPAEALAKETAALANRLAAGPTFAYGQIKRLLRASFDNGLRQQMAFEQEAFCACARTADFAEGVAAFMGRRQPKYEGK